MLTLDVHNAINSASWPTILEVALAKHVPNRLICILRSYLSKRTISVSTTSVQYVKKLCLEFHMAQFLVLTCGTYYKTASCVLKCLPELAFANHVVIVTAVPVTVFLNESLSDTMELVCRWIGHTDYS